MACYNAVLDAWPETTFAQRLKDLPRNYETLREPFICIARELFELRIGEILTYLMPLLMMRQQRIPRNQWVMQQNDRGKKWIERVSIAGFHLAIHLAHILKGIKQQCDSCTTIQSDDWFHDRLRLQHGGSGCLPRQEESCHKHRA